MGLSLGESRKLLDLLRSYVTRPENVLRHRWSENQLVVFDNRITQHYAIDNYDGLPRRLHRVTVAGDVPSGHRGHGEPLGRGGRLALHVRGLAARARARGGLTPSPRSLAAAPPGPVPRGHSRLPDASGKRTALPFPRKGCPWWWASSGPSIVVVHAHSGLLAMAVTRTLGEMRATHPSSGSLSALTEHAIRPRAGFVAGRPVVPGTGASSS